MSNSINYEEVKSIYDSIKELYISYCQNLDSEKKKLEQIVDDIKETKDYITYLENHQKSDAFVFSPRGVISKNNGSAQEGKYDTGKTINFSDCEKKKEELLTLNNKKKDIESEIDKLQSVVVLLEKIKIF